MKNIFRHLISLLTTLFLIYVFFCPILPSNAVIKSPLDRLKSFGGAAGYDTAEADPASSFISVLGSIVSILLGLLGVIFIVLIIYSGFTWMTAAGDEAKVTKAKETIQRAIIGLVIIVSSFAIWELISDKLL